MSNAGSGQVPKSFNSPNRLAQPALAGSRGWVRAAGAIWMLAFVAWLPFEDTETWTTLVLAAGGCIWLGLRWLVVRGSSTPMRGLAAGAILGAGAPLLAITLMAIKSGLHAHGFADFTARQVWQIVSLIPLGIAAGAAAGFVMQLAASRIRK